MAAAAWQEFEDEEEPLVSFGCLSKAPRADHGNGGPVVPASKRAPAKQGKKSSTVAPNVEAACQRSKTAMEWKRVEIAIDKAVQTGHVILSEEALKVHGKAQAVEEDCSLNLLRDRMRLIRVAANREFGPSSAARSKELYDLCLLDPYMKDLSGTLLAVPEGCQTLGAGTRCRDHLLDLQPTVAKVQELMDSHRNAISLLKTIATAVTTEAEGWKANVQALIKAKEDERRAIERAAEKERKAAEQKQKRQEAAAKKKAAALAAAEQKKRDREAIQAGKGEEGEAEGVEQEPNKKRRSRVGKIQELCETDPPILHELRSSSMIVPTIRSEDVHAFVNIIATEPKLPAIARLKKASFKKVMSAI